MSKQIIRIIDAKNSITYVQYSDGSKGFDQLSNTTKAQREHYRLEKTFKTDNLISLTRAA